MRTRSRLLSKRRSLQLPTIREGAEEVPRDAAVAAGVVTDSSGLRRRPASPDDYLLSICHLASPTFPATAAATAPPPASPDTVDATAHAAIRLTERPFLRQRLCLLRHSGGGNKPTVTLLDVRLHREKVEEERVGHLLQGGGERKDWDSSDPLECLYGRQS